MTLRRFLTYVVAPVRVSSLAVLILVLGGACGAHDQVDEEAAALTAGSALPEGPHNASDPISLTHGGKWLRPILSNVGTSADGRIGLNRNYGTIYLITPEAITQPVMNLSNPPGNSIRASKLFNLPDAQLFAAKPLNEQDDNSNAICDPPERHNPKPCAGDSTQDCYDVTIVHSAKYTDNSGANHVHLWGSDVTVSVANPKTSQAALNNISVQGAPVSGPDLANVANVFVPSITGDGRMLVLTINQQGQDNNYRGARPFTWKNNATGLQVSGSYNIMYSYNSKNPACDVAGWNHDFAPITHAHWDPDLIGNPNYTVKFAQFPLRDTEGQPIPDGVDLGGVYPWIDRSGANLFFSQIEQNLFYPQGNSIQTQYPVTGCVPGSSCVLPAQMSLNQDSPNYFRNFDERRNTRGLTVAGLWTHGKEVLIDAALNNTDYGLYGPDKNHYEVQLYGGAPPTEIGTGRDAEGPPSNWQSSTLSPTPLDYTRNTTIVDSFTNLFNYHTITMKPNSVRDVAWIVNMGKASSTISFDDWLDPDALIVADMNASLSFPAQMHPDALPVATYHNGFAFDDTQILQGPANGDIHLQNAATGKKWNIPPFGTATTGTLRIEPVALGGKTGKGLWLDGNSGFQFALPAPASSTSFVSLWWDSRNADAQERRLLTFPDQSVITVESNELKFYARAGGQVLHATTLPGFANNQWTHIALAIDASGTTESVQIFLNGFHLDTWSPSTPSLILTAGAFQVGAVSGVAGIRGWVDDVKVIARIPDLETICNHAGGTLMGVDPGTAAWAKTAAMYPAASHAEVAALLSARGLATFQNYVCYFDSQGDAGTDFNSATEPSVASSSGLHSLHAAIHFPEGPLVFDKPRPDSTRNQFCLSCHQPTQGHTALTPAALGFAAGLNMSDDPRRQPSQPPSLIFGNIPPGLFGPGLPAQGRQGPPQGFSVDAFVFPEGAPGDAGRGRSGN